MGMFDYVKIEYPLPDGHDPTGEEYQTKDTPCQYCEWYRITADGRLEYQNYDVEDHSDPNAEGIMRIVGMAARVNERWEPTDFDGAISFYTSNISGCSGAGLITSDNKPPLSREYKALFDGGKLLWIKLVEIDKHEGSKHYTDRDEWWKDSDAIREARAAKDGGAL